MNTALLCPASADMAPPHYRSRYPGELLVMLAHDRLAAFEAMAQQGDVTQA